MHIRTFRAPNLQAALADIRQQMGSEASVLHTRQVRDGWMGWLGRTQVEVTAGLRGAQDPSKRERITRLEHRPHRETELLRERLLRLGVGDALAQQWTRRAEEALQREHDGQSLGVAPVALAAALRRVVAADIECGSPIRAVPSQRRVVALVGPTGVGKTTTVAKLAAGFRLQQNRSVGLLTIDTYRIAAVQQLQAYAEIMDLPMQVVERPEQMQASLDALGNVDLVLIDTAGRSPHLAARIDQLRTMLTAANPDEIHLVLSATSSAASTTGVLRGFASVQPTATILTKLDETEQTAGVLAAIREHRAAPLSYITTGQQVPDDIEAGAAERVVRPLLAATEAHSNVA